MGILLEGCCGNCCCSPLRARYKRLVDNIFPPNPADGLIKSNMEKLAYYASSSPEKLDRIGEYFAQRIARDLTKHNNGFVVIAMDAMDQLLASCTNQSLNLFIESYLKIVQLLLESQDAGMQLVATHSFTKFANIQEDTPSYHRRYDFFVSKFSALSHDNNPDIDTRIKLRIAGLQGLRGVIRKTVSDDLQVDIWDDNHMDKIVPSLLYNMQEGIDGRGRLHAVSQQEITIDKAVSDSPASVPSSPVNKSPPSEVPAVVAEENLKELVGKASYGNIRSVIRPVLNHLDHHGLWESSDSFEFAVDLFRIIMKSIQSQHSYAVVQILISHLDEKSKSKNIEASIRVRIGIAIVLSSIVAIMASESIGPIVLDIINNLLSHLRCSISNSQANSRTSEGEKRFQETTINTLGEFANNLPDFQKIEIMMFIIGRVPSSTSTSKTDCLIQGILIRSLLKVSTTYNTVNINQALPTAFLKQLLELSLAPDASVRLTVQKIFHQLLDRHDNLSKLSTPCTKDLPQFTIEKAYRQEVMFMKKHGVEIIANIYENLQIIGNTGDNYKAIYTTIALLCIEMNSDEAIIETVRLALSIQDVAISSTSITDRHKAALHAFTAGILYFAAKLSVLPSFVDHVDTIVHNRRGKAPWMLPETNRCFNNNSGRRPSLNASQDLPTELIFDKQIIVNVFRETVQDANRLLQQLNVNSVGKLNMSACNARLSCHETFIRFTVILSCDSLDYVSSSLFLSLSPPVDSNMARSDGDLEAINLQVDSVASSPGTTRVSAL